MNNSSGGYRGRGGANNNRGGGMNNMPGYNRGGFQQPMTGGFQAAPMGGFQGTPMVGMPAYGSFQNRGGMMGGMRGGRGGMGAGGMMGMQMGNMGMGGMGAQMGGMGMGMPQMGTPMGMPGMQGSHISTHANPTGPSPSFVNQARPVYATSQSYTPLAFSAGPQPSSANQARPVYASNQIPGQSTSPATPVGKYSSSGPGVPPSHAGGSFGNQPPSFGPKWAALTQYSPSGSSRSSAHFPSQLVALSTSVTPASLGQNKRLNPSISSSGQVGFQGAQAQYHPVYYQQPQPGHPNVGVGDSTWNPHGAKRTRRE